MNEAAPVSGLTSAEANQLLAQWGPNSISDAEVPAWRRVLEKFSAPVSWLLEATVVLELVLGKYVEAAVILALLIFNAALGLFQESRAQATLTALKSGLALSASVLRDRVWKTVASSELVPGDCIKLSLGGVVSADARISDGDLLLDQSMLTGESMPVEGSAGMNAYAGSLIRRGEATAQVTATGARTKFGRSAELIRDAHVVSSQQTAVFRVVRNLAICNGILIVLMLGYAYRTHMPGAEVIALVLTAILASIPVALPAMFTLAAALSARALTQQGVLPTRLAAVDEAGSMDVLCVDKTGTLTLNQLQITSIHGVDGVADNRVLALAAVASSIGGQDPVDHAIQAAAAALPGSALKQTSFLPFDPATKRSEATYESADGGVQRAVKGAFAAVSMLAAVSSADSDAALALESQGFRVLAVAAGPPKALKFIGLIALSDPPRADSAALIRELTELGIRTVMLTGDAPGTASTVAAQIGLEGFAIFAGILPEDKFRIVKSLQADHNVVGMCGDGANDAPALRQAHLGIAVSSATDIAKAAAGIVLTKPGLAGIVATVKEGRLVFQRILTYTINSITKKTAQVLFLSIGLLMTGHAILTPLLMVMLMTIGDFLGMSLTTDRVRPSPHPNAWDIQSLTLAGALMGAAELLFCAGLFAVGDRYLHMTIGPLQSLAFILIVFANQATTYNNRERRHLWSSRPSGWVLCASAADVVAASLLAGFGIGMQALSIALIAGALIAAALFAVALDFLKVPVFRRLKIE